MDQEPAVVLVVPIAPARSGNGLAMRAGMLLEALSGCAAVHVVIVPVSGSAALGPWLMGLARSITVVDPVTRETARRHTTSQLADPALRARVQATSPLPARAALAPPTLADDVVAALPDEAARPAALLVLRLYLAPLGIVLAERLASSRVVVDVDDDDAALLRTLGDPEEADAFDRLARCWLPDVDTVVAASAVEAASIEVRLGLHEVAVIPNAVRVPERCTSPPGADRLLFVGNLTYQPNLDAALLLAREILPALRERRRDATIDLVGEHGGALERLDGVGGVRVAGTVPDVAPYYDGADAVLVPLRHGGGTRIKVLEAFAYRRPVVATRAALRGLDIEHHEAVIADSAEDVARATERLLTHVDDARSMVARATDLVRNRYTPEVVGPRVRAITLGVSA